MSKREEFIEVVNTFKTVSQSITHVQRRGLLSQAVQNFGLSIEEASEIFISLGLIVGEELNYFEVMELSIEELQNKSATEIENYVETSHSRLYGNSLRAGGLPRSDGRSQEQWRNILNEARDTLIDPVKRREHIAFLQNHVEKPEFDVESTSSLQRTGLEVTPSQELRYHNLPDEFNLPADMVFIPAGEFQMGSMDTETEENTISSVSVSLEGYLIDIYPVTNTQYMTFLVENPQWQKNKIHNELHDGSYLESWLGRRPPRVKENHPVIYVSWYAAMAYAEWIGKRLPTQAEWEKAARGGANGLKYPWGDHINAKLANYGMQVGTTTDVNKFPANEYGIYDMVGNVWEWCISEYQDDTTHQKSEMNAKDISEITINYLQSNSSRIVRGGSWASSERATQLGYHGWAAPNSTHYNYGFRCVKDIVT